MITKRTYKVPIFPNKIEVIIYDDINDVEKYRPDRKEYVSFCDSFPDGFIRIGISSDVGVSFITHEAHHAKSSIWEYIGYKPQSGNDEVDAYLIGWIAKIVIDLYHKHKKNKDAKQD